MFTDKKNHPELNSLEKIKQDGVMDIGIVDFVQIVASWRFFLLS